MASAGQPTDRIGHPGLVAAAEGALDMVEHHCQRSDAAHGIDCLESLYQWHRFSHGILNAT